MSYNFKSHTPTNEVEGLQRVVVATPYIDPILSSIELAIVRAVEDCMLNLYYLIVKIA